MNCIWMTSELVKYKLCDKDLDCDNCEFDKVIRNISINMSNSTSSNGIEQVQNEDILTRLIKRIESETFDNKVIYLQNQLVIKKLFGNAYYLGINPIVLYMMDDFNTIREFNNNQIKRNQIIFNLDGSWGIKQFISPIDFMIIEKINFSQFKLNQWYAIILFNNTEEKDLIFTEDRWHEEKKEVLSNLNSLLVNKPGIGKSMLDGGQKVNFLHQYLGSSMYLELLNKVFYS